jgi:hypothetical protein
MAAILGAATGVSLLLEFLANRQESTVIVRHPELITRKRCSLLS